MLAIAETKLPMYYDLNIFNIRIGSALYVADTLKSTLHCTFTQWVTRLYLLTNSVFNKENHITIHYHRRLTSLMARPGDESRYDWHKEEACCPR